MFFALSISTMQPKTDSRMLEDAIRGIAAGDRDALAELYGATQAAVYGFALSICKNPQDAEDILQDVYLRVWSAADGYEAHGKPMAWLLTITRNLSLMCLRKRSKEADLSQEELEAFFADKSAVTTDDRMLLTSILKVLDETERRIVMLHAAAGMKHREIAVLLEIPLSTVLSKYTRSLAKLKAEIKENAYE